MIDPGAEMKLSPISTNCGMRESILLLLYLTLPILYNVCGVGVRAPRRRRIKPRAIRRIICKLLLLLRMTLARSAVQVSLKTKSLDKRSYLGNAKNLKVNAADKLT